VEEKEGVEYIESWEVRKEIDNGEGVALVEWVG
jgi:hypothetical protein